LFFHAKILARPAGQPRNAPPVLGSAPRSFQFFLYIITSLLLYFAFPLSFRTVFSHAPGSAFSDISIQFLAYY